MNALLEALLSFDPAKPVFVEGESKKIGQLQVPGLHIERMRGARCVLLETALETRVSLLLEEYGHFVADRPALETQLDCLAALHSEARITEWKALAAKGAWREFVAQLLAGHYDEAYRRSAERNFVRLPQAARLRIAAPHEAAFLHAAASLLVESELEAA